MLSAPQQIQQLFDVSFESMLLVCDILLEQLLFGSRREMPSLRSRLFVLALKYRHLLRFQLKRRATIDWNTSMPELRKEIERGANLENYQLNSPYRLSK
jgi:hypothetical protein